MRKCGTYSEVLDLLKKNLQEKGCGCLLDFAVSIKSTDHSKTHVVNKQKLQ